MNAFDTINTVIHGLRQQEKLLQQQYINGLKKVEEEIRSMFAALPDGRQPHTPEKSAKPDFIG